MFFFFFFFLHEKCLLKEQICMKSPSSVLFCGFFFWKNERHLVTLSAECAQTMPSVNYISHSFYIVQRFMVSHWSFMCMSGIWLSIFSFPYNTVIWINISGELPKLVCALILCRSGLGLLMGNFYKLSACQRDSEGVLSFHVFIEVFHVVAWCYN